MMQVRVPIISDSGATCLTGALQWLVGMTPVSYPEEQWDDDRVMSEIMTTESSVVALVMHAADYRDGAIHCGPQVTTALMACAHIRKDYVFLIPLTVEVQIAKETDVTVIVEGGLSCQQPRSLFTSDIRFISALVARQTETTP